MVGVLYSLQARASNGGVTEEEEIPGLSFVAFRRTATLLHLPALSATSDTHQVVSVDPVEWAAIVEADGPD